LERSHCTWARASAFPTRLSARFILEIEDVQWARERLTARRKGVAAADWVTVGPEGTGTLDGRFTVETADGAVIFVQISGRVDLSNGPGHAPSYVTARFEVGDRRYAWMNKLVAAGKGSFSGAMTVLEMCELV